MGCPNCPAIRSCSGTSLLLGSGRKYPYTVFSLMALPEPHFAVPRVIGGGLTTSSLRPAHGNQNNICTRNCMTYRPPNPFLAKTLLQRWVAERCAKASDLKIFSAALSAITCFVFASNPVQGFPSGSAGDNMMTTLHTIHPLVSHLRITRCRRLPEGEGESSFKSDVISTYHGGLAVRTVESSFCHA